MSSISSSTNRYSDQDLAEFKIHIEQKLANSIKESNSLLERIENLSQSKDNDSDRMDDTSNSQDLEMLHRMIGRQQKHIRDLENALIRIHNKHYGICVVSGQLIDKRRLMAVPTTSRSLEAKNGNIVNKEVKIKKPTASKAPTTFSKIIKRTGGTVVEKQNIIPELEFDEDQDENFDLDFDNIEHLNLDEQEE